MAGNLAMTIVLALGAGVLGGPDALSLLLTIAGQRPLLDIAISVFLITVVTAPILGTVLLALFFRDGAGASGGALRAAATDCFAKMTLTVSMGVASLVTACLLAPLLIELGGAEKLRTMLSYAGRSPFVPAGAAAFVLGIFPLARVIRKLRAAADAGAAAAPVAPARARFFPKLALLVPLAGALLLGCFLVLPFLAAEPGPDAAMLSCSA